MCDYFCLLLLLLFLFAARKYELADAEHARHVSARSFSIFRNPVGGSNDEPSEDERRGCTRKVWYFVRRLFSFHTNI